MLWLYAAVASRWVRHRPVPPLLVLGAIGITVRTTVAVASGSTFFYFAQPVLGSLVVGCVFLVSIAVGRPMVQALALEFWPLTPDMLAHPAVGRLLRRLTFLWAGINLAIGASTFTLLILLPLPLFVAVKQVVGVVDHRRRHRHHDRPVSADRAARWLRRRSTSPRRRARSVVGRAPARVGLTACSRARPVPARGANPR